MDDQERVTLQIADGVVSVLFLDSHLNSIPHDNEPWKSIEIALQSQASKTLVLDFSNVTFLSSSVLGKIVGLKRKFGGEIALQHLSEMLTEVFRVTGLNRLFVLKAQ